MSEDTSSQDGEWVPRIDAAQVLGLSERTLSRRIASGECQTKRIDGRVLVFIPAIELSRDMASQGRPPTSHDETVAGQWQHPSSHDAMLAGQMAISALERQLDQALSRSSTAEQAAAMWQERARNLEAENGRLQELLALPAHEEDDLSTVAGEPHWWQWWRKRK